MTKPITARDVSADAAAAAGAAAVADAVSVVVVVAAAVAAATTNTALRPRSTGTVHTSAKARLTSVAISVPPSGESFGIQQSMHELIAIKLSYRTWTKSLAVISVPLYCIVY